MVRRRGWLLVLGVPLVLAACSGGGSTASGALDLAPSPTDTPASAPAAAPSPTARPAASAAPTHTAAPTGAATTQATHAPSTAPKARQTSRPPTHKATPSPAKKPPAAFTIRAYDYYFSPANPAVAVGTPVKVIDAGSSSHTWTSGSNGIHTGPFDSGNLDSGQSYTYTFSKAGSYNFYCQYHYATNGMKGHITVT
jgi:plastocyanin